MGAHATAHARGALEGFIGLGIHSHIDSHLTVCAAIATGDTHIVLHSNSESAEFLNQSH